MEEIKEQEMGEVEEQMPKDVKTNRKNHTTIFCPSTYKANSSEVKI